MSFKSEAWIVIFGKVPGKVDSVEGNVERMQGPLNSDTEGLEPKTSAV